MQTNLPKLPKSAHFIAECYYSWGGENHINILVNTNIDVKKLLQSDVRGYIEFVDQHLADYFDFANYEDDNEIFSIAEIERNTDESLENFITRFLSTISIDELKNIQLGGSLGLSVNRSKPSTFDGFRAVSEEEALILVKHMPSAQVVSLV